MHGSHAHSHSHGNGHAHDHGHAHGEPSDKRYTVAIALNLAFVAVEVAGGIYANSTALLSDAAHNLSDILGLALAGGAAWLATRPGSQQRTYGYSKAGVLAALANALILVAVSGGILWEAISRLFAPAPTQGLMVMVVAALGVVINGASAMLFIAGRKQDINVRGAFLHMLSDAAVSAAVIVAGLIIWLTHWSWVDPLVSIGVVALILWSTWGLLRESLALAMDAAPAHIDVAAVRNYLASQPGVVAVHDLHIWAMSPTEPALTAHLVRPEGGDDAFLAAITDGVAHKFAIQHVTLQVERAQRDDCAEC